MRRTLIPAVLLFSFMLFFLRANRGAVSSTEPPPLPPPSIESAKPGDQLIELASRVGKDESLYDIFLRNGLPMQELLLITKASKGVHNLNRLNPGNRYQIEFDGKSVVSSFRYHIDEDTILSVTREGEGFEAEKIEVPYEKRTAHIGGEIKDNLVSSIRSPLLALGLSDIFAWDIDFTADLRNGDRFALVVEELWLDGEFKKYGAILSARFVNQGRAYSAYRFVDNGRAGYYDQRGRSLERAFLKAPLSYRRISSRYTKKRYHPVLKTYRPHLGVDYAAARGTPVSSVGDGKIIFSGRKGPNGKMVIIKHPNGYKTYYGHLGRITKRARKWARVRQGDVIGYVGSTGRATGPHLDYRIKRNGRFINPERLVSPRTGGVSKFSIAEFRRVRNGLDPVLSSIIEPGEKGILTASAGR